MQSRSSRQMASNEFHQWTVGEHKTLSSVVVLTPGADQLKVHKRKGVKLLHLTELWVPRQVRGKGHARCLLNTVIEWADSESIDLWLYCVPYGRRPKMSVDKLRALYEDYGFEVTEGSTDDLEMIRRYGETY